MISVGVMARKPILLPLSEEIDRAVVVVVWKGFCEAYVVMIAGME